MFNVPSEKSGAPASIPTHVAYDSDDLISVSGSDVPTECDQNRPHNRADDSNLEVSGSKQSSLDALCTLQSVAWAARVVKHDDGHPDQVLLMV